MLQHYFTSSAFEACTTYPALGRTLPFVVDMHMLVAKLPKGRRDAQAHYKSEGQDADGHHRRRAVATAHLVEVLSDGWDGRAGALGAFQCSDRGVLEAVAYTPHV